MSVSSDFFTALEQAKDAQCVGCGYCCRRAPCAAAFRVYGPVTECPALQYDADRKRYFCELCRLPGSIGEKYREELGVGAGCCSALFNTDRENIPEPAVPAPEPKLDRQLRAFLHAMGRMGPFGPSGDLLWLVVHGAAKELGLGDGWARTCLLAIREERGEKADEFMGEVPVETGREGKDA